MHPRLTRRAVAEGLGTALLLAAVVGSGIMAARLAGGNVALALLANAIATGGALVALIATFSPISGAHFNPVVTLAFAARGELEWRAAVAYLPAQFGGAVAGVWLAHVMFGLRLRYRLRTTAGCLILAHPRSAACRERGPLTVPSGRQPAAPRRVFRFTIALELQVCLAVLDWIGMHLKSDEMTKSTTMTVRIPPEVSTKLGLLARDLKRSKSYLAGEAIASFVEHNAWQIEEIKEALAEAKSGAPGVPHAKVEKWVGSWGKKNELKRPRAKT
jgi:predicted transcriptional regulator